MVVPQKHVNENLSLILKVNQMGKDVHNYA